MSTRPMRRAPPNTLKISLDSVRTVRSKRAASMGLRLYRLPARPVRLRGSLGPHGRSGSLRTQAVAAGASHRRAARRVEDRGPGGLRSHLAVRSPDRAGGRSDAADL